MKSKATIVTTPQESQFPVLMIAKRGQQGMIVMFDSEQSGMVVNIEHCNTGCHYKVGTYVTSWVKCSNTAEWERFYGTVELSND